MFATFSTIWGKYFCSLYTPPSNHVKLTITAISWKSSTTLKQKLTDNKISHVNRWLAQFTPGSREDIVCRKDGTLRHSEPSAGENLSCIVVFVLVYYSLIAVMVWFIIFAYSFHLRVIGKTKNLPSESFVNFF